MSDAAPTSADPPRPPGARVFISYAHADEVLRAGLRTHMAAVEREGLVRAWDDRDIGGGDDWAVAIETRLNQADVILLLVSADFINSQYCYGKELARALERNADETDRAIVIPIILRACAWQNMAFGHLQALPTGGRPLAEWKTPDDYYTAVTQGLRERLIDADSGWGIPPPPPPPQRVWAIALVAAAVAVSVIAWWRHQANLVDSQVALALQDLRSGRAAAAVSALQPLCKAWVRRNACFVLQKSELGAQLEQPDVLPLETFGARVKALTARAPQDPDLLFYAAQLVLLDPQQSGRHAQARADIERAIELAGGRLPEAHYYLANLEMLAGRHADALPLLDRALDPALNPVAPEHYLNARAYARARTGDVNGAQRDYEQSAERGSILSRIELAELLWTVSAFERASDQLRAAHGALDDASKPLVGRNALPWAFEAENGAVVLKQPIEKQCFARWMHRAGLVLAERAEPDTPPTWADCGPEATRIAAAVAAALARASGAGMGDAGRARALDFARRHQLR